MKKINKGAAFLKAKNLKDLATALAIEYKTLTYHIYGVPIENQYKEFIIKKRNGTNRSILAPSSGIKLIQKRLSKVLLEIFQNKSWVMVQKIVGVFLQNIF